jgi:hypothetical protein
MLTSVVREGNWDVTRYARSIRIVAASIGLSEQEIGVVAHTGVEGVPPVDSAVHDTVIPGVIEVDLSHMANGSGLRDDGANHGRKLKNPIVIGCNLPVRRRRPVGVNHDVTVDGSASVEARVDGRKPNDTLGVGRISTTERGVTIGHSGCNTGSRSTGSTWGVVGSKASVLTSSIGPPAINTHCQHPERRKRGAILQLDESIGHRRATRHINDTDIEFHLCGWDKNL